MNSTEDCTNKARYIVSAVDTALDVLELVSREPGSSLADLAKMANLNKSRTMRFLVTLETRGLVRKDELGNFYLAYKLTILGDRARNQLDHLKLIQHILDKLRDETQETVQYRVLDGLQTVCLAKSISHQDIRVHTDTGRPRELYVGSSKSILAFGGEELLRDVLERPRSAFTENTLVEPAELKRQLNEIRSNGFSVSTSERMEGAVAIGAPIFNPDGTATSCLSLLGPEFRVSSNLERLSSALLTASLEVQGLIAFSNKK